MRSGLWSCLLLQAALSFLLLSTACVYGCEQNKSASCGWGAQCYGGECNCTDDNYTLHKNKWDCMNDSCAEEKDCLECTEDGVCKRCVQFIEESTRKCLATCTGEAKIVHSGEVEGNVCVVSEAEKDDNMELIIGVVAGVGSGLIICLIVAIIVCVHLKRTRKNVNLNQTRYTSGNMQVGNIKKVPIYDNIGFEPDVTLVHNVVDRDVYLEELERLKPDATTLLAILNELRGKLRNMDKSDPRVSTYKGVIHQLCRVLVILHKKDPGQGIPSDALGLMEWAHQMIDDRQMESTQSEDSESTQVNKISYVDVPESEQYATPNVKKENTYASLKKRTSQNMLSPVSFYHSVPVPIDSPKSSNHINHISVSQNNTIKRKGEYDIPWDLKARQDSIASLNCSGSDLTLGYFANGRFYDPTPRQHHARAKKEPEIYAPASSYSDRSQPVFTTFGGPSGIASYPQSLSSDTSTVINEEEQDQQEEDGEGFPFDMRDATEPVEV